MKRRGFSLIEILVVIALIGILASITIIAIGKLQTNAKRQQTHLALQTAQGLYSEFDRIARRRFGVSAMPCPALVTTGAADRNGYAVLMTRDMMAQLRSSPTNASALGKMSAGATMAFSITLPVPPQWAVGTAYDIGDRVLNTVTDPSTSLLVTTYYTCVQATSGATTDNANFWVTSTADATVPVLLDGWANPIIFVPGARLGRDISSGASTGFLFASGNKFQQASPDNRSFWASAGPDGDFSKGDDNLYSFEK